MDYIQPVNRHQVSFGSLDEQIEADNEVRFIEAFVEQLNLKQLGYNFNTLKSEGRLLYHPTVFLKLYLYGYFNGIRSTTTGSGRPYPNNPLTVVIFAKNYDKFDMPFEDRFKSQNIRLKGTILNYTNTCHS